MFDLLLTVCVAAAAETCAERRVAFAQPLGQGACAEAAPARAEQWLGDRPELRLEHWTCSPSAAAPALETIEVAPGVLVHAGAVATPGSDNRGDVANLAAVIGRDGVAVIDAGGSRAVAEAWLAAIRRTTVRPVRWLILTHMHPDHVLGASVFAEAGAEIIGHARLGRALDARRHTYLQNFERLLGPAAMAGARIPTPDRGIETSTALDIGGRSLLLRPWPSAHTDNDLTVLDRQTGTLFAGDLVFLDHAPALDGSITGWLDNLAALAAGQAERLVPGHGPATAAFPDALAPTRGYLAALAEETRAAIAAGEPMSRAIRHLGESQRSDWSLFDEYNPRNATAAYKELEWE